jgi:hypothetical protein
MVGEICARLEAKDSSYRQQKRICGLSGSMKIHPEPLVKMNLAGISAWCFSPSWVVSGVKSPL